MSMPRRALAAALVAAILAPAAPAAARCSNPNRLPIQFLILEGQHDALPWLVEAPFLGYRFHRTLHFQIRWNETARYATVDPVNQLDWNKTMGFTTYDNHKNSVRLGWRYAPDTDRIELAYYGYLAGVREYPMLGSVALDEWADVRIDFWDTGMSVTVNGVTHTETGDLGEPAWLPIGTVLTQTMYFGGDEVAPRTIVAEVRGVVVDRPCRP